MPRTTCQDRIDAAVQDALYEERRSIAQMIKRVEFTADAWTFRVVDDLLRDIVADIERRNT